MLRAGRGRICTADARIGCMVFGTVNGAAAADARNGRGTVTGGRATTDAVRAAGAVVVFGGRPGVELYIRNTSPQVWGRSRILTKPP